MASAGGNSGGGSAGAPRSVSSLQVAHAAMVRFGLTVAKRRLRNYDPGSPPPGALSSREGTGGFDLTVPVRSRGPVRNPIESLRSATLAHTPVRSLRYVRRRTKS